MNKKLKPIIWRFYLFRFFSAFHLFGAVIIPFYTQWAGMTLFTAQMLQAWFAFCLFAFEIPTGYIADKFGRRNSMLLGGLIATFSFVIYGATPSLSLFILGEMLLALGVALTTGADEAWLYETLKQHGQSDQMQSVNGRSKSLQFAAMMVSAIIGGWIGQNFGLNMPMLLTSLSALGATLTLITLREPNNGAESVAKSAREHLVSSLTFLTSSRKMKLLTLNLVSISTVAYFVIWYYQPLLSKQGVPISQFGLFHSIMLGSEIIISANFSWLQKSFGSIANYMRSTALITALGFLLVGFFPSLVTIVFFLILAGGFGLTRIDFAKGHFHDLIPSDQRATIGSSLSFFRRFGITIANILVGFAATQQFHLTLVALAVIAAAASFIPFPEHQDT